MLSACRTAIRFDSIRFGCAVLCCLCLLQRKLQPLGAGTDAYQTNAAPNLTESLLEVVITR
jgi:hypothetical protein